MNEHTTSRQALVIVGVTMVALIFNGATSYAGQILTLTLMAGAIIVAPPQNLDDKWLRLLSVAAILFSFTAFLPAAWFPIPAWRSAAGEIGIALPSFVSPQPWLTLKAICLLSAGLIWLNYVLSKHWTRVERSRICRGIAIAAIALAASYLAFKLLKKPWFGAGYDDQFGPFPNKNQTASVLMLGGIILVGLIRRPSLERPLHRVLWGIGLVIVIGGLLAVGSRSGILLFALGSIIIGLIRTNLKTVAVIASTLLLAITGLIITEADILQKFIGDNGVVDTAKANGRWSLYADSMKMTSQSAITGTGLGNFSDIFAFNRELSVAPNRALHPDSDLLWVISEMGIPGAVLLTLVALTALGFALPLKPEPTNPSRRDHSLRITCFVAATAFAINSAIDVPTHRLGSLLPGLLVLGLATRPRKASQTTSYNLRYPFAACAAIPALILILLPSVSHPLDVNKYFTKAQIHLQNGRLTAAAEDFERARFLRPDNAELTFNEGLIWLDISPNHAIAAWRNCLQRSTRLGTDTDYFNRIVKECSGHPELHDELWLLANGEPRWLSAALQRTDSGVTPQRLRQLIDANPDLDGWNRDQLTIFLSAFARHHSPDELLALVDRNPSWPALCWRPVSNALAAKGDYQAAFALVASICTAPDMNVLHTTLSLDALRSAHLRTPESPTPAIRLAHQHMRRGNYPQALSVLQEITTSQQATPPLVQYMIAHCLLQHSQAKEAHEALLSYVESVQK